MKMLTIRARFFDDVFPPALVQSLRRFSRPSTITFEGPYSTWREALSHSIGYDRDQILYKVLAATLKVKNGEAV